MSVHPVSWTLSGVLLAVGVVALASCGRPAAEDPATPAAPAPVLRVVDPFTPQPAAADVAAAYMTITNSGTADDALIAASTEVAERVELHQSIVEDGMATMRLVSAITVPAGGKAVLQRGGYHLMLINPKPLTEGDRYLLTLHFDQSGELNVEVPVLGLDAGLDHTNLHDRHTDGGAHER
jgi:copper(I)-binding protein